MRDWLGETFGRRGWVFWLLGGWLLALVMTCLPVLARGQGGPAEGRERSLQGSDGVVSGLPVSEGTATVVGVVLDTAQAAVPEAAITLEGIKSQKPMQARSGAEGLFTFGAVPVGSYRIRIEREGFAAWTGEVAVGEGQVCTVPGIALGMPVTSTAVEVRASAHDVAEAQVALEEQQRVLGVFPNFYASYAPDAEPLSAGQKMRLAVRFSADPVAFMMAGVVAKSEQRANAFPGYGRGSAGYARRFGAAYGDGLTSTILGQAVLPALFHQDPRYFVKGTGSVPSRVLYAMASAVICKGDNRRWQLNYSNVAGNFLSAGLSNAYYPAAQRGMGLVATNALTATALGAVGGLFQEFLLRRMTPRVPEYAAVR